MKKKLISVVGARPQFIKAAALSRVLIGNPDVEEILVHTGQHYDQNMSPVFFAELQIPEPKYNLNISGGSHSAMTGAMLIALEDLFVHEQPDAVLVYGDTNSTLAGALAAAKLNIPVIHVEAGLRSFNMEMPEEINRIVADRLSTLLFCPTSEAIKNLQHEGITSGVYHTGDLMYDTVLFALKHITQHPIDLPFVTTEKDFAFLTIHRADATENVDNLSTILDYVEKFSAKLDLHIIFAVHPRTRAVLGKINCAIPDNMTLTEPLGYFATQACLAKAKYVLTDSGGLQKEAYFHRVPCITLRSETEWVETITNGWNKLWTQERFSDRKDITDFGDGQAAQIIANIISEKIA